MVLREARVKRNALLPNVPEIWRSHNTYNNVRPRLLLQTSNHKRQRSLPLLPFPSPSHHRTRHAISQRLDEPQRKSRQDPWVRKQSEVRALGENDNAVRAHSFDGVVVDYRGTLSNYCAVHGHGEAQSGEEGFDAVERMADVSSMPRGKRRKEGRTR
jgi:hypothetical protein